MCHVLLLVCALSACATTAYYSQALAGQWSLMRSAEPVSNLLADPGVPPGLKQQLRQALAIKSFAGDRLALPVGNTFSQYASLDRNHVVVNVVAVPEFALTPHRWCYPLIGCQSYRGYFDAGDARQEARRWQQQGFDTVVAGVTAYSTLGWFNDPLHSGFTRLPDERMAALIFHELSHKVVYVAGDTAFNESFATAVELEGLRLWLAEQGRSEDFQRAQEGQQQRSQTQALVTAASRELASLYARTDLPKEAMRAQKTAVFEQLRREYLALVRIWNRPGPLGSDPTTLNNAHLALFRQYHQYVPGFRRLLQQHHYDFEAFYQAVRGLAQQPEASRRARLQDLAKGFHEYL
ncbi:aminopeptidase [Marinobacter sp. X15-166B]|uniref:aminopeptidase n=1 Tax=Marinobacter sp. X15-166B TaxID=1897620 RepID=UPI001D17311E|nr:aminopeptidase [Marinobacter sp. X15-166B]